MSRDFRLTENVIESIDLGHRSHAPLPTYKHPTLPLYRFVSVLFFVNVVLTNVFVIFSCRPSSVSSQSTEGRGFATLQMKTHHQRNVRASSVT